MIPRPSKERHTQFMQVISDSTGKQFEEVQRTWRARYLHRVTGSEESMESEIKRFLEELGSSTGSEVITPVMEEYYDLTRSLVVPFEDVKPSLKGLKRNGFMIGLMTNCSLNLPPIFEGLDINELFDSRTYSAREGLTKPQPELFHRALASLGVKAENCFFVGDGDNRELEGAKDVGLKAIMIERGAEAGDYLIDPTDNWEPKISSFYELENIISRCP
jgi:putative hydrolase of the HAD superfamily